VLYENGGSTIVIEPSQEVFALAARTPDGFVVSGSFEHFAKAESKITQGVPKDTIEKPTANDFITLNIKDMDVREAIRLIYFGRGKNLIFSNDVKGTSTLFVENVPYQTALEVILNENNLIKREEGNLIRIMTEEKYDKMTEETRRVKEEEVRQIVEQPLITEIVPVNYTKAADFQPIAELMLSDRGRLVLNERGNSFIVTDIPHAVEQMKKLLKDIDFATPQVTIEARIVEVTDTDSLNLGIQWGGKYVGTNLSNKDFPSSIVVTGDSFTGAQGISGNGYVVNFPFTPTQDLGVGNIALSMGSISGRYNLDVALQALQNQSKLKIISAPRVTTLDNIEAEINSGGKAIIVPTGDNTQTEEVETGIRLTVTPHITSNNMVFMDIEIEKSNIVPGSLTSNTVETEEKKATTQVLLADGETTVIGGILEDELNEGVSGVPYLSKIPILGFFFRNKASSRTKRELMLFLTPRIVNPRNEQLQTDVNAGGIR
jgi:type IV pilus assembly protein PilQ